MTQEFKLGATTKQALVKAEGLIGGTVAIKTTDGLAAPSTLEIDPAIRTALIELHPRFTFWADYLVLHECGHLIRSFQPGYALPYLDTERVTELDRQLKNKQPHLALHYGARWTGACRGWLGGLAGQLVNHPADAAIEAWIHATAPELREQQQAYLAMNWHSLTAEPDRQVRSGTPALVWQASRAMDQAMALLLLPFLPPGTSAPAASSKARGLWSFCEKNQQENEFLDRATTDYWAQQLDLSGLVRWRENG